MHVDQLVQVLSRGVDLACRLRTAELRGVAADRPHLRLERLGDINHEGRLHRVFAVGEGVQDFERPVGLAGRPVLREAGEVAGVAAQLRGDAVVGMPAHGEGEDDDPRARPPDQADERRLGRPVVPEVPVSPIAIETAPATTALHTGTPASNWSAALSSSPIESPSRMPSTPPISVSVAASTRNCHRISRRVAPMALRTPISRVRSVTETIMIAMTPIPPTSRATLESTSITRKNAPVSLLNTSRIWSCVIRSKVSGSPGRSPRMRRSCTVTASIAWVTATPSFGFTTSHSAFVSS